MATNIAHRQRQEFETELAERVAPLLAESASLARFKQVVVNAIVRNPDLWNADRRSLVLACADCAKDGLIPDGREAALVTFKTKNKQTSQFELRVTYMPMIYGIRKRMRNSGDVVVAEAHLVHQNDAFDYQLGDEPKIIHKPALGERGPEIGAYAIIRLASGEPYREYMSRAEIEKAREVSRAKDDGPWIKWWGEMARKTVLRRAAKSVPMSSDVERLVNRDDVTAEDVAPTMQVVSPPPRPTRADYSTAPKPDLDGEYDRIMDDHEPGADEAPAGGGAPGPRKVHESLSAEPVSVADSAPAADGGPGDASPALAGATNIGQTATLAHATQVYDQAMATIAAATSVPDLTHAMNNIAGAIAVHLDPIEQAAIKDAADKRRIAINKGRK